jgi:hypothetical protein
VTRTSRRTALSVAAISALSVGMATSVAVAAPQAPHAPKLGTTVENGKTTVALDKKDFSALSSHGYGLTATGKATLKKKVLTLPVSGGKYAAGNGTIRQIGGFKISKGSVSVTIKNLVVKPAQGTGTALVTHDGRISAVTVGQPQAGGPAGTNGLTYSDYTIALSKPVIKVLDKDFSTKFFATHTSVGVGSTTLHFKS